MSNNDRVKTRANNPLPEETAVGHGGDPLLAAEIVVEDSDQRQQDRNASPGTVVEHRRSENTVEPG